MQSFFFAPVVQKKKRRTVSENVAYIEKALPTPKRCRALRCKVRFRAGNGNQQVIFLRKITCGGCSATRHGLIPSATPLQRKTPRGGVAVLFRAGNGNQQVIFLRKITCGSCGKVFVTVESFPLCSFIDLFMYTSQHTGVRFRVLPAPKENATRWRGVFLWSG